MRGWIAGLLGAAAWALAACSPAAPTAAPAGEPALWRIADSDSEIWIFGSVHMLPAGVEWRNDRLNAAFASADEFITETATGPEALEAFQQASTQHGAMPAGERLSDRLSRQDQVRLRRAINANGLDSAAVEGTRPWLVALQLSLMAAMREGQSPDNGVENILFAEAARDGKRMSYFETPDEQVRILADLPPDAEAHFLAVTLREIEGDSAAAMAAMDEAWAEGDTVTLDRMLAEQWREAGPVVHEAMILRRNRAWADEIAERLDSSGTIFIAVGAAHLLGDGSVIDLLRDRGVTVEGP